jgi:LacI family gluconate utilization system Gnt-I transcriptional repressor
MLIGFSHTDIGREVAGFLMTRGRSRFAVVRAEDERAVRRTSSFAAMAEKNGCKPVTVINVGESRSLKGGREAFVKIMKQSPDVDAIFCSSDLLALGVITEARAEGITVPGQIAVMGFGDIPFMADMVPALSTVRINGADIGQQAARFLIDRAEGRPVSPNIVDVGFSIVARETT